MKIYTRTGDDGTTGLLYGGRIGKDDPVAEVVGDVDEAQAAMGMARAQMERDSELDVMLVERERDLYIVMAELATAPANRHRLVPGETLVTSSMVDVIEDCIELLSGRFEPLREFVLPGQTAVAAALDLARTVVRRAERSAVAARRVAATGVAAAGVAPVEGAMLAHAESQVVPYLNRLSALLWAMARAQEGRVLPARRSET